MSPDSPQDCPADVTSSDDVSDDSHPVGAVRHTSHRRILIGAGTALLVAATVISLVAAWITPVPPQYVCPPNCGRPPTLPAEEPAGQPTTGPPAGAAGPPVSSYPRFSPSDGSFSVQYPKNGAQGAVTVTDTMRPNGVEVQFSDLQGRLTLFSQPADNQTAREIATALIQRYYPGAQRAYEITNAMVGYQPGYGEVDDYTSPTATAGYTNTRVLILVAVKHGLALVAAAEGPYVAFEPSTEQNPRGTGITGHPSGTGLALAQRMGPFINSFRWQGDPDR